MTYRFAPLLLVLVAGAAGAAMEVEGATPGTKHNIPVTASPVRNPDVAYDAANNVYLAVTGNAVVQGQFLSATGALLGSRFDLSTNSSLYQHSPRVRCEEGVCLAVWHEGSPVVTKARIITYASGPIGVPVPLGPEKSAWEFGAGIAFSHSANEFLVTWMGDFPALNNIYYARVNKSGQLLQTTALTTSSAYEREPSVAYNPVSDEFVIAYAGTFFVDGVEQAYVSAQRIKAGAKVGGPIQLDTAKSTYIPQAEYNPASESVVIGWYRSTKIYGREVRANGTLGALTVLSGTYAAYDGLDIAHNANTSTFLLVTLSSGVENAAVEISQSLVPAPAFILTSNGGNGNYVPRVVSSTADPKWLSVTSRNFSSLWATFALGQACTSNCGGSGGGGGGGGGEEPPPATLSVTSLVADKAFPITVGTSVTFTATATGGSTPYTYKFVTYNSSTGWQVTQDYSALNQLTYFPAAGTNAVQVWVRNAGSSSTYDAYLSSGFFTVNGSTPVITSFTADRTFPQPVNTLVTFTATVAGGISPQYQFWKHNVSTGWTLGQDYSGTNTFSYFPETGTNAVQVWVRNTGSVAGYDTYQSSGYFQITGTTPVVVSSLTANTTFPQPVNTSVTFTATAGGGTNPLQYKFWKYNGGTGWAVGQDWGALNTFTYFPAVGTNVVQVWVRSNGSVADYDAYKSSGYFTITSLGAPTSVILTPQQSFPVALNTLVSFSASALGGTDVQYQFWTYHANTGWVIAQPYGPLNTFGYFPQAGTNAVQVWVRNAGSSATWEAWASSGYFTVNP